MAEGRPPDSRPATVHGAERLTAGSRDRPREQPTGGVSAVRRALLQFAAVGAVLALLLAVAMVEVVRRADRLQAEQRAHQLGTALANDVVGPVLDVGDPGSRQVLDTLLGSRARDGSIVRIKVWSPDGQVLWADDDRLIGRRYDLDPRDVALLGTRDAYAEVTVLDKPENEFEAALDGTFMEVYAGFFDRTGRPLLFEAYQPVGELSADVTRLDLFALSLAWLVLLLVFVLPLALALARRVDHAQGERQRLLQQAIAASDIERRRLAQDLHDGVIQDLAGVAYVFSALEQQLEAYPAALATAQRANGIVQRDVAALRALSTDLCPPDLGDGGLEDALDELLDRCAQAGLVTRLQVDCPPELPAGIALVAYRSVREALRNVERHADASCVQVQVQGTDARLIVQVSDDGRGFDPQAPAPTGHLGLRVLRDGVTQAGGTLDLRSRPGSTVLEVGLPLR